MRRARRPRSVARFARHARRLPPRTPTPRGQVATERRPRAPPRRGGRNRPAAPIVLRPHPTNSRLGCLSGDLATGNVGYSPMQDPLRHPRRKRGAGSALARGSTVARVRGGADSRSAVARGSRVRGGVGAVRGARCGRGARVRSGAGSALTGGSAVARARGGGGFAVRGGAGLAGLRWRGRGFAVARARFAVRARVHSGAGAVRGTGRGARGAGAACGAVRGRGFAVAVARARLVVRCVGAGSRWRGFAVRDGASAGGLWWCGLSDWRGRRTWRGAEVDRSVGVRRRHIEPERSRPAASHVRQRALDLGPDSVGGINCFSGDQCGPARRRCSARGGGRRRRAACLVVLG